MFWKVLWFSCFFCLSLAWSNFWGSLLQDDTVHGVGSEDDCLNSPHMCAVIQSPFFSIVISLRECTLMFLEIDREDTTVVW